MPFAHFAKPLCVVLVRLQCRQLICAFLRTQVRHVVPCHECLPVCIGLQSDEHERTVVPQSYGDEYAVEVALALHGLHILHHAAHGEVLLVLLMMVLPAPHEASAHCLLGAEQPGGQAATDDTVVFSSHLRQVLSRRAAGGRCQAECLEEMLAGNKSMLIGRHARRVRLSTHAVPFTLLIATEKDFIKQAHGLHLGQVLYMVAQGIDGGKDGVAAHVARQGYGVLHLSYQQVLLFELAVGTGDVGAVCRDNNSIEGKETEGGGEKNLHEDKGVLPSVRPKVFKSHLFWFKDSTIGLRSERHEGMRAAMRLSTTQQRKAMRKSVGVKNMAGSRLKS